MVFPTQEIGGDEGAAYLSKRLAEMLEANGETIEFLLDEGSFVLKVSLKPRGRNNIITHKFNTPVK